MENEKEAVYMFIQETFTKYESELVESFCFLVEIQILPVGALS